MTTTKWKMDPTHSELGFKIKHLMITNVSGSFKNFDVEVETTGEDFTTASITATVDVNSIYTNNDQRDQHLRTSDFFESEKFPHFHFLSTEIEEGNENTFYVHGTLTMKGVTRPLKLTVEYSGVTKDPWGGERAGFVISGKINRSEWGINFNNVLETGGLALGEEVKIHSEVQLVKQLAAVTA